MIVNVSFSGPTSCTSGCPQVSPKSALEALFRADTMGTLTLCLPTAPRSPPWILFPWVPPCILTSPAHPPILVPDNQRNSWPGLQLPGLPQSCEEGGLTKRRRGVCVCVQNVTSWPPLRCARCPQHENPPAWAVSSGDRDPPPHPPCLQ
eukprot:Hpha_TRINITY_DN7716_c0_g1::TRINITY_DN7716_c0_g1_i1::g.85493::m.85493